MSYVRHDISIDEPSQGSYITVFKRDDMETPLADLNFFEGDRTLEQLIALRKGISLAINEMEKIPKNK